MKTYKVIAIPDKTRIIINLGEIDNENPNSTLVDRDIEINELGIQLKDPDTKEVIGQYNPVKARLTITNSYDTYSIARKQIVKISTPFQQIISSPMLKTTEKISFEPLNVKNDEISNTTLRSHIISIGDLVTLI
ncbi:hypothetical protein HBP99_11990 [Listeria booriae]|uniref:hypothetical protein n=1 Tax=Listeria booriae TaxID=1552123 RepID=UPI0016240E23|nr:hypothetical protein [Listeria booriae]MBC2369359.1 hypothetical protein [Listeria booriae]